MRLLKSKYVLVVMVYLLIFFKLVCYVLVKEGVIIFQLGGGSDAVYYHNYAIGNVDLAVNSWPIMLSWLNEHGVYSRDFISYLLLFANILLIPYLLVKSSGLSFYRNQREYLSLIFLSLFYPTLYYYTFDIYRDVFMASCFLIGCCGVRYWISIKHRLKFLFVFLFLFIFGWYLVTLRPYLGYAFLLSLFLWNVRFTKKRILMYFIIYLFALFFTNYLGFLDDLVTYRAGFSENDSTGSTLGIDFSDPLMFIPNLFLSFLGQMLGLYIVNPESLAIFFLETVPFIYMFSYVLKNISYADKFMRFLLMFFIIYASVWLIGNDNLGTAVRLRFYNYFVIYICFFIIKSNNIFIVKKKEFVT